MRISNAIYWSLLALSPAVVLCSFDGNLSRSVLPLSWQLHQIKGAQSSDPTACIQYEENYEEPSLDCWSPYPAIDNDCDWKKCAADTVADACGEGTQWSGLVKYSQVAVDRTDENIGWRAKSSPCSGIIDCLEGMPDGFKSCNAGPLFAHFSDQGQRTVGTGCYTPAITEGAPSGCTPCSAGAPKPFHQSNVDWIWYEQISCPQTL